MQPELVELALHGCLRRPADGNEALHPADLGVHARCNDDRRSAAAGDDGAAVDHVGALGQRHPAGEGFDRFGDGQALSRQRGFAYGKSGGLNDARIGWHHIPALQVDDIAGHQCLCLDLAHRHVAQQAGHRGTFGLETGQDALGTHLARIADRCIEAHHCRDGDRLEQRAGYQRNPGSARQDGDGEGLDLFSQDASGRAEMI